MSLVPITNTPRAYAWGQPGGIARTLGWPATDEPEAELWLGAHPLSPSRPVDGRVDWADLADWERRTGRSLPWLMKVLAAGAPLSLQAHPTAARARAGFAREEAAGIGLTERERNYKDPNAKPEVIVAVEDGFDALCGFRPVDQTLDALDALDALGPRSREPAVGCWRRLLAGEDGVRAAFEWLLSDASEVTDLVGAITAAATRRPDRFAPVGRLAAHHPDDPGIAIALMLNHVSLAAGEALWLPAGNIHAYLSGVGMEVMGPSDNVLRGGLTHKHVDRRELQAVLDFTPGDPPLLRPVDLGGQAVAYRPATVPSGADVDFQLVAATGACTVTTGGPAIGLVVDGRFDLHTASDTARLHRGQAVFSDDAGAIEVRGSGTLYLASSLP